MTETRKMFTVVEARRALPLVRRIAKDLQEAVDVLTKLPGGTSFLYGASQLDELAPKIQKQADALKDRIENLSREIAELGVELKGFQPVLVDFPSWREEEVVYLCWAEGESDISFWHSVSTGFRGRKPI